LAEWLRSGLQSFLDFRQFLALESQNYEEIGALDQR
jgi:hypothetical protein